MGDVGELCLLFDDFGLVVLGGVVGLCWSDV